jgi:hypothetical protein
MLIKKTPSDVRRVFFDSPLGLVFGLFLFSSDVYESSGNDFSGEIFDLFGLEFYESINEREEGIVLPG